MIIIAPDKFKGTMTAPDVAATIADVLDGSMPCRLCPMADGGEGTAATLAALHGMKAMTIGGFNSLMQPVGDVAYYVSPDGDGGGGGATVALDCATVLSLTLLDRPDVMHASSMALGLMMAGIARRHPGARMLLGVGGTSTCDGGAGMLQGLGARFAGINRPVTPLDTVTAVDLAPMTSLPPVTALCDVDVPLAGALDFAAQKGARADDMPVLARFLSAIDRCYPGRDVPTPSAGAAGGIGLALARCLGATIVDGADAFVRTITSRPDMASPALVITGEGRLDRQTAMGKLPSRIARHYRARSVPTVVVAGSVAPDAPVGHFDLVIDCSRYALPGEPLTPSTARRRLRDAIAHNLPALLRLANPKIP